MKWNKSKSVILSKVCVCIFALVLLGLDIGCVWFVDRSTALLHPTGTWQKGYLIGLVYVCSVPGWLTLFSLWQILDRIWKGQVFVEENIRDMRRTSWCCILVAVLCMISAVAAPTLAVIAIMAGFVGLVVRIVKNVFQQAMSMKDELDFTV